MKKEIKTLPVKDICKFKRNESGLLNRARLHQGWWRACILNEEEGYNPNDNSRTIYNTINKGHESGKNFLTQEVAEFVKRELEAWQSKSTGAMESDRLFNNLLSSQPLAFNFFAPLAMDLDLATKIIKRIDPSVIKVTQICFEHAPKDNHTKDNTASDVAIFVETKSGPGYIAIESKYTDNFSQKEYDKPSYKELYNEYGSFKEPYENLIKANFNQLFRNRLVAESMKREEKSHISSFVFCHPEDSKSIKLSNLFASYLSETAGQHKTITYADFISIWQSLEIDWKSREYSMLLWARYLGSPLSKELIG